MFILGANDSANSDTQSISDRKSSVLPVQERTKIVASGRAAVKRARPPKPSALGNHSKQIFDTGPRESIASQKVGDSRLVSHSSHVSLESRKSESNHGSLHEGDHKSVTAAAIVIAQSSASINDNLAAGHPVAEPPVKEVIKPQVIRSGRAAVALSGRSAARPATKPTEKTASSTNSEDIDTDSKDKKGIFGFGKKK
jgi:hypothetical protein